MEEITRQLDLPMRGERIWTIQVHRASASEVARVLQTNFGVNKATPFLRPGQRPGVSPPVQLGADLAISQIIPNESQGMLVIVATEPAYLRILALVKRLDPSPELGRSTSDIVHVLPIENANAEDIARVLSAMGASVGRSGGGNYRRRPGNWGPALQPRSTAAGLFTEEVRISPDKPTNSLVILAAERDYITARDLLRKLDTPRRQVFIEATILEVSIDKSRKLGVASHGGTTIGSDPNQSLIFGGSEPSTDVNSILFSPAALSGLAAGLRGPPIPGADRILGLPPGTSIPAFGVFLQALQNNGDVNIVSMPHLLTTDNEKASIQVGQNLPFPGALGGFPGVPAGAGLPGASFGFGTSVQRQDVALKLDITPHVNDSDFVRLEISNELSDIANPNFNGLGPSTSKRTIKSVVTVRDQQSVVLGGLIKDSVSEQVDKVPLLGDIPILGYLFKRTKRTIVKQNLLIVLTPHIIKGPEDLGRLFERKLAERRDFVERNSAFRDQRDYEATIDYHAKRGLLEEINRTAIEAEQDAAELHVAESRRPREVDGEVEVDSK
jgi:general secretion pathway protein D